MSHSGERLTFFISDHEEKESQINMLNKQVDEMTYKIQTLEDENSDQKIFAKYQEDKIEESTKKLE